jgi:hypothetical protein
MTKAEEQDSVTGPLLEDLSAFVRRFVALSPAQADTCALWVVHTHALEATDYTPYLDINSPVPRSGKTRLLEVLKLVAHNSWFTARTTVSNLVRRIDKDRSTLLLDESDTTFQVKGDYGEALRGILNSGFERDGTCSMSVHTGNDWEPRDFRTFSPKAIAGIGHLPLTIRDRSIPIHLKRAKRVEDVQRFRKRRVGPEGKELKQRIEIWAKRNIEKLREMTPELPDELNDRQQDVCEPLLAVADLAGGCWPSRARNALMELCSDMALPDDSTGLRLLADIRNVLAELHIDRVSTLDLLERLRKREDSPWSEIDHGRQLSSYRLSQLLKPFDVRPRDIRFGERVQKGYLRSDFKDACERYLSQEGQQAQQSNAYAGPSHFCEGQQASSVADEKSAESMAITRDVADVASSVLGCSELGLIAKVQVQGNPKNGNHCLIHPRNVTNWWLRGGNDPVCGLCHPNPESI